MSVLVDTSVRVEHLRGSETPTRHHLLDLLRGPRVATTDVVVVEVLSGPTDEVEADRLARSSPASSACASTPPRTPSPPLPSTGPAGAAARPPAHAWTA